MHSRPLRRREARAGLLFVLPWVLSLLVFTSYPVLASAYFSFTNYNIIESPRWIGTDNYRTMIFSDPSFWKGTLNTAFYTLVSVPLGLITSLGLAILLHMQAKGIAIYRTLFYLPALVPPVAATIVFVMMFNPDGGLINGVLGFLGLPQPGWFTDPLWSKPTLLIMTLWGIGPATLIFLAGLNDIPQSLLDAAAVDGAGQLEKFRFVTLPLLTPIILFNLVMGVIGSFQVFTPALVIGGTTGQPLESMLMYMVHLYRNAFAYFKMGYASALAVVMFLTILAVTLLILWSARSWVYFEDGIKDA